MRLLVVMFLCLACQSATAPTERYAGVYVLTSPVPYQHTYANAPLTVVAETLTIRPQGYWQRDYAFGGGSSGQSPMGQTFVANDSIYFNGGGTYDDPLLDVGRLTGNTLQVRALTSPPSVFVYERH